MEGLIRLIAYLSPDAIWGILRTGSEYVLWLSPMILVLNVAVTIMPQSKELPGGKPDLGVVASSFVVPFIAFMAYVAFGY